MATRKEILRRKTALIGDLREAHRSGSLRMGEMAPSVRDLAVKYELSVGVVAQQLQVLEKDGLLYTIPRAGTFIGQPHAHATDLYLFIRPLTWGDREMVLGFEEEIARRGGTPLVMDFKQVKEQLAGGVMPSLSGIFYFLPRETDRVQETRRVVDELAAQALLGENKTPAQVNFAEFESTDLPTDTVGFDNAGGGRQATQYLLARGHRRIAYLGAHAARDARGSQWSQERMKGWQTALEGVGQSTRQLCFLPARPAPRSELSSPALLQRAARRLLAQAQATAVVAANDDAALQLIQACRDEQRPASQWPAMVSFDDSLSNERNMLTSVRLPWEAVGRTAASLLWKRRHDQLESTPVCRMIPLRIIPRLSCRANWSLVESLQTEKHQYAF